MDAKLRLIGLTIFVCAFLLVAASVHRQFIGSASYAHPLFSGVVVWSFLLLMLLAVLNVAFAVIHLFKKSMKQSRTNLFVAVCAILVCIAAVFIDAATLLYAT